MWILLMTAAAETLSLDETSGHLAPGAVDGGAVVITADSYLPFAMVGYWSGILAAPTTIDGIPCAAAPIQIQGGHLAGCILSEAAQLGPLPLSGGSRLEVIPGQPQPIFRATLPEGITLASRRYPAGEELVFHPDGAVWFRIQSAASAPPDVPLPCRWGREADRVLLHPDGALAQCILQQPATIGTHTLPADTIISLDPAGRLRWAAPGGPWGDHGAGSRVLFDGDGSIAAVRSRYQVYDDDDIQHPSWRVRLGFYYGYPWAE